jgi:CubicO group peptidase (beta-lactamase class C family)
MMKIAHRIALSILLAAAVCAQITIPETSAGKLFSGWLNAINTGDRATMQQFIEKHMAWSKVERDLAMRNQTGGFDVKKVEESSGTRLVVLAQERGPGRHFVRITTDVTADEPDKIAGMLVQPAQPPANLAAPKMTPAQAEAARNGIPYRQFSAWLEAFNSADRTRFRQFLDTNFPGRDLDRDMTFRQQTGGFEIRALEQATPTTLTGLVQERHSDQFGQFTIVVEAEEPHRITQLGINAIPRPPDFPVQRLSEAETIAALRGKLEKDTAAGRFSGTVLVAKRGKILFSGAYGLADREKKIENKLDTQFRIGSMNKMFTAVSILQLVQAGKINLTDPLGNYIKDYPNREVAAKVTIHQLLTHTGGAGDIFGPQFDAHRLELRTLNDYMALYGKRAPEFEPGSRFSYSNYGMVLLGVVVERVSGQSYYDYVAEHVYKPAGMTLTGSEPESEAVPGRSVGYMQPDEGGAWTPNTPTLPYRGSSAGGGYSTVGDLMKFADALMAHKLLDAEHTDLLITGKVEAGRGRMYAYGFEDGRKDGNGAVGHGGGAPGMNGDLRIYPKSGYVVAVLSNLDPPAAQQVSSFLDLRLPQ